MGRAAARDVREELVALGFVRGDGKAGRNFYSHEPSRTVVRIDVARGEVWLQGVNEEADEYACLLTFAPMRLVREAARIAAEGATRFPAGVYFTSRQRALEYVGDMAERFGARVEIELEMEVRVLGSESGWHVVSHLRREAMAPYFEWMKRRREQERPNK
jgi:hypothetical protein